MLLILCCLAAPFLQPRLFLFSIVITRLLDRACFFRRLKFPMLMIDKIIIYFCKLTGSVQENKGKNEVLVQKFCESSKAVQEDWLAMGRFGSVIL